MQWRDSRWHAMLELPNSRTHDRVPVLEGANLDLVNSQSTRSAADFVCWLQVNSSELHPKTSYHAPSVVPYGPLPVAQSTPFCGSVAARPVPSGMRTSPFSRSYSVTDFEGMSSASTRAYCDLACSEANVPGAPPFMSTAPEFGSFYASHRAWLPADGLNKYPNAMFYPDQEIPASFTQPAYSGTGSTTHLQVLPTDNPSLFQATSRSVIAAENADRTLPPPGSQGVNDARNGNMMPVPVSETTGSNIEATVDPKTVADSMSRNSGRNAVHPSQTTTTSSGLAMIGGYVTSSAPGSLPMSETIDAGAAMEDLDTTSCLYNYNGNS